MKRHSDHLAGARIVVIGAGAIGSLVAYRVAQAGARVSVVERRYPGAGTSGSSFAWVNAFGKQPREYHSLNMRGIREHEVLAAELNGSWLHLDGGLLWDHSGDAARADQLRQKVRLMKSWGYRVDTITPDALMRDLEPDLFLKDGADEIYVTPQEGWIESTTMCHSVIHTAMTQYQLAFIEGDVSGLSGPGGGVDTVKLANGRVLSADVVVNAAGPNAGRIAQLAGSDLPIKKHVGAILTTQPVPTCLRHVVRTPEINIRPDGAGRLVLHADKMDSALEAAGLSEVPASAVEFALEAARRILPSLKWVETEAVRVGLRPMPLDGKSVIGFDASVPGLYDATTHSGITLAAIVARLVTEELAGSEAPELATFRPDRFRASPNPVAGSVGDSE